MFWIALRNLWCDWRKPLRCVQADTVVRWQRERFRRFWARLSQPQRRRRGRPRTGAELRRLIAQMATANPLWRAPRIHGELKMLGIALSERTVSRLLRTLRRPPDQTWRTFLHNHVGQLVSTDFFIVPTITMKVLFVFIVLEHNRRKVLHFNVTEHPTGAWTAQRGVRARHTVRASARWTGRSATSNWVGLQRLRRRLTGFVNSIAPASAKPRSRGGCTSVRRILEAKR
jgi:putative transposase